MALSEKQIARLKKIAKVIDGGNLSIAKYLIELEEKLDDYTPSMEEAIKKIAVKIKGNDGHTPTKQELLALINPLIPDIPKVVHGKNYILTRQDKKEIARSIEIPVLEKKVIVQKTEVIKEQPIVTQLIKEVALHETAEDTRNKLEALLGEEKLKIEAVHNLREELETLKKTGGNHTVSTSNRGLYQLLDVNVSGIAVDQSIKWNGSQWIPYTPGTGGGSGTVTSVTGVTNRTTITGTPTIAPIVDISASYAGQTSITTLGTITTGVWNGTAIDHNGLSNLTVGDVHTQYALLTGRATPQQFAFGSASSASTGYLTSTSNATKGKYFLNSAGTIAVDELNLRLGIGIASPSATLQSVSTSTTQFAAGQSDSIKWTATTASTTGITTLNATGGTLPSFWMSSQTVIGNPQTVNTDPRTVIIGQIGNRDYNPASGTYNQVNKGIFQVTSHKNSSGTPSDGFNKDMGVFISVDNTTNLYDGTGVIQFWGGTSSTGFLAINPAGGGVGINTPSASASDVALGIGANPSNNGYIRLQNTSSYGGGATPYTGLLFQQSSGGSSSYIKGGVIFNGYDGSGFARGQLLFALDPTASAVNVQNTLSTSTRMNIDYVAGVVTIGQGVTIGAGKLNVMSTTEQFRAYYDASNYFSTTVASTGGTTFGLTGTSPLFTFSQGVQAPNIGVGTAPLASTGLLIAGTGYTSNLIAATGSLSPTAGTNATLYRIAGTIVEAGSGTHNLMSAMFIGATTVTGGAATVNNTAGLYIENAMTATVTGVNYAIWVDDGISRLDGKVICGDTLRLQGYLVANLPAGTQGDKAFVTNALAPTYLATVVGGGAIVTEVFYNGSAWVCT